MSVALLEQLGFRHVGHWSNEDGLRFTLTDGHQCTEILYAFVISQTVVYLGKSIRTLSARMYNYQKPGPSQKTNLANNVRISAALLHGEVVEIWALTNCEPMSYRGMPLNIAAGLEDGLIVRLRPAWNGSTIVD